MVRAVVANLGEAIENSQSPYVYLQKTSVPYTTITNRAQVTDFSQDLLPRFGIERNLIQSAVELQNEFGPSGQKIFKPTNDIHNAVRFVGSTWQSYVDANGAYSQCASATSDYMEITFYGTALNILGSFILASLNSVDVYVDGAVSPTTVAITGTAGSNILNTRFYSTYRPINVASNLSLGLHTVRIVFNNASHGITGYEVVNTGSNIQLVPGVMYDASKRVEKSSLTTTAYNSSFESGTLSTRGGCVEVYQKTDGSVAKAVNPTKASAAYLVSTDHTGEEIVRRYYWREFATGLTDDLGFQSGVVDKKHTLSDGTTNLVIKNCGLGASSTNIQSLTLSTNSVSTLSFCFVGTGLDLTWYAGGGGGTNTNANAHEVFIDGVSVGNWDTVGTSQIRTKKIVSGLPFGTHIVRIKRNVSDVWALNIVDFIVYAPAKPSIPSGARSLARYYIMADFVANTTAGITTIATGVMRKSPQYEIIYANGTGGSVDWGFSGAPVENCPVGLYIETNRQNAYFDYVFFGTGFEFRSPVASNMSASIQFSLQRLDTGGSLQNLNTTNFPTIATSAYGTGVTFTASTGIADFNDASSLDGAGIRVSNLPLGLYKVRALNNTASSYIVIGCLDIITPVYSYKETEFFSQQNVFNVGSNSILDLRNIFSNDLPEVRKVHKVNMNSTNGSTSTNADPVPVPATCFVLRSTGKPFEISWQGLAWNVTVGHNVTTELFINGVKYDSGISLDASTSGYLMSSARSTLVMLPEGIYFVAVFYRRGAAGTAGVDSFVLTAREIN